MYADFAHATFSLDGRRIGGIADEKIVTLPMIFSDAERDVAVEWNALSYVVLREN